jgi:flagellar hook-associated protein 2
MATISSPGIASGLDIQTIVTQLVALEKAPLKQLQTQATTQQAKLSTWGNIKSMVSTLGDAAAKLSSAGGWNAVKASSSNAAAITVSASSGAPAMSLNMEVQRLAQAQSTASSALTAGSAVGAGSLSIEIGTWSGSSFTAGSGSPVSVTIDADDTLSDVASKINDADSGVTATVLRDASGERLLVRSTETGETNGFRMTADDDDGNDTDAAGLSRMAFAVGNANGQSLSQSGLNALATVNNVSISSASNKLTDTLQGMTIQLSQVTTAPVLIDVTKDLDTVKSNIKAFVDAYNTLNTTLNTAMRYDEATKVAGTLQGDATAAGLQNALRGMMRSVTASSPFTRLSDIGLEIKNQGKMDIVSSKLDAALNDNFDGLKDLFMAAGTDATSRGFGLKVNTFADGLLDTDGMVANRTAALQASIRRNGLEQERVSDRAARVETRLLSQYNAMDAAVGRLNALNSFVSQQITLWNKG